MGIGEYEEWIPASWIDDYFDLVADLCDIDDKHPDYFSLLAEFCWLFDFGRKWKDGYYKMPMYDDIHLFNAEQLYDILANGYPAIDQEMIDTNNQPYRFEKA